MSIKDILFLFIRLQLEQMYHILDGLSHRNVSLVAISRSLNAECVTIFRPVFYDQSALKIIIANCMLSLLN